MKSKNSVQYALSEIFLYELMIIMSFSKCFRQPNLYVVLTISTICFHLSGVSKFYLNLQTQSYLVVTYLVV